MAQVVVTFAQANVFGRAPVFAPRGAKTEELSSSGTHAPTTVLAAEGDYCRIANNGEGYIWAVVGNAATATVAGSTCYVVGPGQDLHLGPCSSGDRCSVIDDS